jgi:hypothetical protein
MKIFKTFKDKENWFETTEEEMVAKTQNIYPDPIQVIKDNGTIQNNWSIWKLDTPDNVNYLKDQIKKLEAEYWHLYQIGENPAVLVMIQGAIDDYKMELRSKQ